MSKVIVITGAGVGLGRALARGFAADGHSVVLLGRTLSKVEATAADIGASAMAVQCDVASADSVREAFEVIAKVHPKIDVLINNAAVFQPFQVADATDEDILTPIMINLVGSIWCARAAIPMMEPGGHIINVGSESASMVYPHLTLYQTSKAGLDRFSESLYLELEPRGIRVTLVSAGAMMEEDKAWDVDPQRAMAFAQAAMAAGLNLRERPITHVKSVVGMFRAIIDLPADLHTERVSLHAWRAPQ